jgi:cell division septation protein DedD
LIAFAAWAPCACAPHRYTWTNLKHDIGTCWEYWPEYDVVQKVGSTFVSPICVSGRTLKFAVAPGPRGEAAEGVGAMHVEEGPTASEPQSVEDSPSEQSQSTDGLPAVDASPAVPAPVVETSSSEEPKDSAVSEPQGARWEVQVGALRDSTAAEALARPLREQGYQIRIRPPDGADDWYRVRVTGLASKAEARVLAQRLSVGEYPGAWVPPGP